MMNWLYHRPVQRPSSGICWFWSHAPLWDLDYAVSLLQFLVKICNARSGYQWCLATLWFCRCNAFCSRSSKVMLFGTQLTYSMMRWFHHRPVQRHPLGSCWEPSHAPLWERSAAKLHQTNKPKSAKDDRDVCMYWLISFDVGLALSSLWGDAFF